MNTPPDRPVNPWLALLVLALGGFMTLLDLTIVNIAIPSIISELGASLDEILWILNAYSLLYAVLLITSARLGDLWGPRRMFILGVAVFTLASLASGLSHTALELILARAGQGLGAAILAPQGLAIIMNMIARGILPSEKSGPFFAVFGSLSGLAVLLGPTLGGYIVTHWGWRWIFYINLPVGLATVLLALAFVPNILPHVRHRLDFSGVALATAGLLGVVFGLVEGQRYNWGVVWNGITIAEILAAGIVLLAIFAVHQYRRQGREPLINFALFANRNYSLMVLVLVAMGFSMLGLFLPLTIFFQSVLGLSAVAAGLTLAPQPLAMMLLMPVAAILGDRVNPKLLLIPGLLLFALGMADIAWTASPDAGRWSFLPGLILSGVGMSGIWMPVFSLATRGLKPELSGVASGVLNTLQELGGVVAGAVIGAILQNRLAVALHNHALDAAQQLPQTARGGFVQSFSNVAQHSLNAPTPAAGMQLPPGVPPEVGPKLLQLGQSVFAQGFTDAMRPTMWVPIAIVILAALLCLAVRWRKATAVEEMSTGAAPVGE